VPSAPLRRAAILAIAAVGLATVSGCALASPTVITKPYVASDGTNADLPLPDGTSISMRNFVVVLDKAGGAGQVIGAVTYTGKGTLRFSIEAKNIAQVHSIEATKEEIAANGSTAPVQPSVVFDVTGGELTQVGPTGVPFILPIVNVGPGQYIDLTASSPATGSVTWPVPVVAAVGYYAGLTATSAPSPSATPTSTETSPDETPAETTTTSP
jgi:hypothetical protein